jgi:hypothetical protein
MNTARVLAQPPLVPPRDQVGYRSIFAAQAPATYVE